MIVGWYRSWWRRRRTGAAFSVLGVLLLAGCVFGPAKTSRMPSLDQPKVIVLESIASEHARALLSELGLNAVSIPERNAIAMEGESSTTTYQASLSGSPSCRRPAWCPFTYKTE